VSTFSGEDHAFLHPWRAQLSVASAKLLDERCIDFDFNTLHIDPLGLIVTAHLGEHLSVKGRQPGEPGGLQSSSLLSG
jgi:hypothetical protein